ncbi:MAG: glycosyltransferase [Pirellulales bacterium]|nr:glycosyltransferase [Pirellulales bacterium]
MSEPKEAAPATLLVFSDDWGRHPSSCQHLVRRLLPRYPVLWVNTIGMRRLALDHITFCRGIQKLRSWASPRVPRPADEPAADNPRVLNPRMWPTFGPVVGRRLNARLLCRQLAPILQAARRPVVAVTTVPIVADLVGRLPVDRWVYYCVDDFSKWPSLDRSAIEPMEERLARRADVLIAVSEKLQDRLAAWGRASELLTHGVDLARWRDVADESPAELARLARPLVLFWGSIDWQMDVGFVRRLADDLSRGTMAFVGPRSDEPAELFAIPRVVHVPAVPYARLPAFAREADVLVMPYLDAPGLRESQPLKLKEYLASGKPAVVRDLPANRAWADALDLVATPEEFSARVRQRLAEGLPTAQAVARRRLAGEDWTDKAARFEQLAVFQPIDSHRDDEVAHAE